ncbi:uncharacterized protein LOC128249829 [Octopus bimaculoides]|uniref:uncharacterized protein LOC128249829 n=1 Tax=Octopus bimaculoides TaxID=37653 RepID=UPI0022E3B8BB|nr:uncharacterized protein LOC128249829 [Octopus bimaculoides]
MRYLILLLFAIRFAESRIIPTGECIALDTQRCKIAYDRFKIKKTMCNDYEGFLRCVETREDRCYIKYRVRHICARKMDHDREVKRKLRDRHEYKHESTTSSSSRSIIKMTFRGVIVTAFVGTLLMHNKVN